MGAFEQDYRKALRLEKARKYAAQSRERNIKPTGCAHCALMSKLPEVQLLVANYKPYKTIAEVWNV